MNFNIGGGGVRKMNIFFFFGGGGGGGEDFVDSFVGSSQNLTLFRSHFYAFYGQHGGYFLGC